MNALDIHCLVSALQFQSDANIAHNADGDVYIGRGLGKTSSRYDDPVRTGEQALNAKFSLPICRYYTSNGGPGGLHENLSARDSRRAGILDQSPKRSVRILGAQNHSQRKEQEGKCANVSTPRSEPAGASGAYHFRLLHLVFLPMF